MEFLKYEILHNNYCQQRDHATVLRLLNHFYFTHYSIHSIHFYSFFFAVKKTVMFFSALYAKHF